MCTEQTRKGHKGEKTKQSQQALGQRALRTFPGDYKSQATVRVARLTPIIPRGLVVLFNGGSTSDPSKSGVN